MKYLVIDTSTSLGTLVACFDERRLLLLRQNSDSKKQNENLPLMVRDILAPLDYGFKDIDKILVTRGPGSFTGIRIGLSFARGLGFASGIEVVGVTNFDAMLGNCSFQDKDVLVAIDSKKGDWFLKTPNSKAVAGGISQAAELIKDMKYPKIVGYGAGDLGDKLGIDLVFETQVTAFGILNAYLSADKGADFEPSPLYIRNADVTVKPCT